MEKLLSSLAKYYRALLFELSTQAGKHFVDLNAVLRYGLTADLSLFVSEIEELINTETISFNIEKASSSSINKIIEKANELEEREEREGLFEDIEVSPEEQERKNASAILVAIYRRQEFDPYNREVIIGFPLVSGKIGRKKFCAPLFYYKAHIDFDPLKSKIILTKDFEIPALNFQLIKHLVESDEEIEMIRQKILPYLYSIEDFGLSAIKEIIKMLSELIEGFRGIDYPSQASTLKNALGSREYNGAKIINTSIVVNAKRTNAYLIDDLTQIAQKDTIDDETVINTILSEPAEPVDNENINDRNDTDSENQSLLLFPLPSNKAQRLAATKAEKSHLLVVQGPPGTGKSQTIVNIICHLVSQGKTVLVTSHQNKALEVITKNMPKINYLAMSLLKGEKESINELTNKIEGFHSYVSNVDINRYTQLKKSHWAKLREINYHAKRLQVRFSELKIIEREQCPTYFKYHKIRDYDIIDTSDSIPEGMDHVITNALSEYSNLLQRLKKDYSAIEVFLPNNDLQALKAKVEQFSVFLEYCKMRDFDYIVPSDSIPDGTDSIVGQALSEYSSLLQKIKENFSDIVKLLPAQDPTLNIQDNSIDISIESIGQLIRIYDLVKENVLDDNDVLEFCQQILKFTSQSDEIINYLDNLLLWMNKYCNDLIKNLKVLSETYNLKIDLQIIKKQAEKYGNELTDISRCIDNLNNSFAELQTVGRIDGYPEYPDLVFLEESVIHLGTLGGGVSSWWKWSLFPSVRTSLKFFISNGFPKIIYKNRVKTLEKIKVWHRHWTLRNQISKNLRYLVEMGVPIKNLSLKPHMRELYEKFNLAQKYLQLIVALNAFPSTHIDTIRNIIEQQMLFGISAFSGVERFKKCLEKTKILLEANSTLAGLKSNNHIKNLCVTLLAPVEKTICQLYIAERAEKMVKKLKELYPYFYDYKRFKTLEQSALKTLPQTCAKLREMVLTENNSPNLNHPELVVKAYRLSSSLKENLLHDFQSLNETLIKRLSPSFEDYIKLKTIEQNDLKSLKETFHKIKITILKGNDLQALQRPELIVEAFRLSSFIREDLLKNPDDINEVSASIMRQKEESRELILKILDTSRKLSLKQAESDQVTLFLINKLNRLLKRKRKTYSFVQLREQINYEQLLSVFPCWIMSIEDVARIFPLESGLFDYLIVDESSQCNQATTLHLAYRAKRMIVVGDSKQMKNPNTQFLSDAVVRLNLTKYGLDKHPKAEFLHGRNSLLDLAIGCQDISPVFLNEHFRCEPPIIAFSNMKFYDNRLQTLTPFRKKRFTPCMEIKVINGAYDDPDDKKQNIAEGQAVIAELKRMINSGELEGDKQGEKLTIGILSPFRQQAALLQSLMYETFEDNPSVLKEHEIIASTVDGFQGDERDVILYSFRYALNSKPGTIHVLQREDEHSSGRLNVAFSRARRKVVCFVSMPKDKFPKGLIRDYLHHAASEQNRPYSRLGNPSERKKCQSEFERNVFDELARRGLEVYTQVPCTGFFIDFVVIDNEGRRMAVECDGDFHYEDGDLREEDYQRQDIIERYGWFVHRIPSRRYYAAPEKAMDALLQDLKKQEIDIEISCNETEEKSFPETAQVSVQEVSKDEESFSVAIEDKIIAILSEEGPMPLWLIAQKLGQSKEEIMPKLQKLLEQQYVINYYDEGSRVKMWKAID
ncbi:MAG: AAA domain-containing protein [Thermodesulfovibrionales bacterium]|nr:AAA domain-containing protein [Thermodesulfovibrionales bacterium]